jgi:hypothetical protein
VDEAARTVEIEAFSGIVVDIGHDAAVGLWPRRALGEAVGGGEPEAHFSLSLREDDV